jgi:hypothetical protein
VLHHKDTPLTASMCSADMDVTRCSGPSTDEITVPIYHRVGVGIVMGYGLDGPGSIPGSTRFVSSPQHPDRLWGPPSLLFNGYRGLFPRG